MGMHNKAQRTAGIKVIKNRSDIGAGTRGSDLGIDAIEVAAINRGDDFFNRYDYLDVETTNESVYAKETCDFAKRAQHVYEQCKRLCNAVSDTVSKGYFSVVLSGDHSSALGTISGIKSANPTERLGVIWLDAHADIHSPYTSPSGNLHGMPMAAALNVNNTDCMLNDISVATSACWESMKNLGHEGAKINADDIVYFGVRETEQPEDTLMDRLGIKNYTVADVRRSGIQSCVSEALERLSNCDSIYLLFDVDSMDCNLVSTGTGTPAPDGFNPLEIIEIIEMVIRSQRVVCLELVEVNPLLDLKGNHMAETAFTVLERAVTLSESLSFRLSRKRS